MDRIIDGVLIGDEETEQVLPSTQSVQVPRKRNRVIIGRRCHPHLARTVLLSTPPNPCSDPCQLRADNSPTW